MIYSVKKDRQIGTDYAFLGEKSISEIYYGDKLVFRQKFSSDCVVTIDQRDSVTSPDDVINGDVNNDFIRYILDTSMTYRGKLLPNGNMLLIRSNSGRYITMINDDTEYEDNSANQQYIGDGFTKIPKFYLWSRMLDEDMYEAHFSLGYPTELPTDTYIEEFPSNYLISTEVCKLNPQGRIGTLFVQDGGYGITGNILGYREGAKNRGKGFALMTYEEFKLIYWISVLSVGTFQAGRLPQNPFGTVALFSDRGEWLDGITINKGIAEIRMLDGSTRYSTKLYENENYGETPTVSYKTGKMQLGRYLDLLPKESSNINRFDAESWVNMGENKIPRIKAGRPENIQPIGFGFDRGEEGYNSTGCRLTFRGNFEYTTDPEYFKSVPLIS